MEYPKLPLSPASRRQISQSLRLQRGMTLVEWMISITIGLVLLAGLTALIAQQSSTQVELEKSSRQIENGRYAMQLLQEDIQLAGYYGEFSNVGVATPASTDPCSTVLTVMEALMVFPVQGYDFPSGSTVRPSCINAANHLAGTDILVIRHVEPAAVTIAAAASAAGGLRYLQSGLTPSGMEFSKKMGTGEDTSSVPPVFTLIQKDGVTLSPLRKFLVHIYFVSPCNVMSNNSTCSSSDDGGTPIPTLKRLEFNNAGGFVTTSLVEGIEKLQIDYGFDDMPSTGGDGAPDNYAKDAATVADWVNVMSVRLHVLARNNERTVGYQDTKTYNLGLDGTTTATNDGFKRRVFSQLIRVVNPSSRRDS